MKRASNTFTIAEIAALLRVTSAADRRDMDSAQRYAQTHAAISARGKLQRMREKIMDSLDDEQLGQAIEDDAPPMPRQKYQRVKWGATKGEA
jgi:hypothetical protein